MKDTLDTLNAYSKEYYSDMGDIYLVSMIAYNKLVHCPSTAEGFILPTFYEDLELLVSDFKLAIIPAHTA